MSASTSAATTASASATSSSVSASTNSKIQIIKKLLMHYASKEGSGDKKIFIYKPEHMDTTFQHLSNANLIGLTCDLSDEDANIVLRIFDMIHSHNFYLFDLSYIDAIEDYCYDISGHPGDGDGDITLPFTSSAVKSELRNGTDIENILKYLSFVPSKVDEEFDEDGNDMNVYYRCDHGTLIEFMDVHNGDTYVSHPMTETGPKQKFYTISEIIEEFL